ncbi:SCO family protein [Winogradskyella sp. PG-2]|uniref:SCO family protein n=1 Tax=Winogradskyella sp. PG-2 TaxID=754409 RepID=UPI00045862F1|nr:SCO family protein [Winogradskyella sp. PG-2]BAO76803.1 SCO1/SenC family lipoprotein [Winogradskyella sp. PG-2]
MKSFVFIFTFLCCFSCAEKESNKPEVEVKQPLVTALPYFDSPDFTSKWEKVKHKIPEFSFTNQDGLTITNQTYKGKIYVADFFFTTCPGICPKLTKNMNILQNTYKNNDNILLLSHTVMPWVDSVEKLKAYEVNNNVDSKKWNLLTGDKDKLYDIARNGYFADEDFKKTQDESEFIHTENFVLVDKEGHIRGVYNGTIELDIQRLMRHIKILEQDN